MGQRVMTAERGARQLHLLLGGIRSTTPPAPLSMTRDDLEAGVCG